MTGRPRFSGRLEGSICCAFSREKERLGGGMKKFRSVLGGRSRLIETTEQQTGAQRDAAQGEGGGRSGAV